MPSLYSYILHLSSRWNWKKTAGSRWTWFGVKVPRTLDYPTINLNLRYNAPCDHNACPSQTDRQVNIVAIARRFVLTNTSCANNVSGRMQLKSLRGLYVCSADNFASSSVLECSSSRRHSAVESKYRELAASANFDQRQLSCSVCMSVRNGILSVDKTIVFYCF